ncbi:hypothetical protein BCV69DRAFT_179807 [Microstroma glucosiphilum]|uniref:LigT-like protein n=1 Tax=Pseudomicrostroma glucosiphilum TaxID=1684307 RepID=A0A316U6U4_9BASI|nr:hypothetical protein BCV69DRAFT_179807 [Pseudomicrostroma glucosiphilum]PWN20959.1 hypothetical protein BCV69DRAFT_179807 [Pseudomicrostroma glucosiphilum]
MQCLLLALSLPQRLAELNNIMRHRFKKESQRPYFPHISLLYADIPAEEARGQIARLQKEGWFERVGSAASGAGRPQEEQGKGGEEAVRVKDVGSEVSFDEVQLWDCNGPVAGWKKLRSMSLVEQR